MMRSTSLVLLLALPWGGAASAQSIPSSYRHIEHGQEAGGFFGTLAASTGQFEIGPKPGPMMGGRYVIELGGPVFLEGLASYFTTTRDVIDPRREEGDRSLGETEANIVAIDARLGFSLTGRRTWKRMSPYLVTGIGVAFDAAGEGELDQVLEPEDRYQFGTRFTASMGGGVRYMVSQKIMLRLDGTLTLWRLGTPPGFDNPEKNLGAVPENQWVGGYGLTIGTAWRF